MFGGVDSTYVSDKTVSHFMFSKSPFHTSSPYAVCGHLSIPLQEATPKRAPERRIRSDTSGTTV